MVGPHLGDTYVGWLVVEGRPSLAADIARSRLVRNYDHVGTALCRRRLLLVNTSPIFRDGAWLGLYGVSRVNTLA